MTSKTFVYSGSASYFTIPVGVTSITMELWGAGGGNQPGGGGQPGAGGYLKCTQSVTPGHVLTLIVGGKGGQGGSGAGHEGAGGYYGGGIGGLQTGSGMNGSGGGGLSSISDKTAGVVLAIAGAGGASGYAGGGSGGDGGGTTGGTGSGAHSGTGGTQSAGGTNRHGSFGSLPGSDGASLAGGAGDWYNGGGGGCGYYGGGGGGSDGAVRGYGGGGGSSYYAPASTSVTNTRGGGTTGNGKIVLTYNMPPNAPTPVSPVAYQSEDISGASVLFQWRNSFNEIGDAQLAFQIRIGVAGSGIFSYYTGEITQAGVQTNIASSEFTAGTTYTWQVQAYGVKSGTAGPWSVPVRFTATEPPTTPVLVHPASGEIITNVNYTATWDNSGLDQETYQLVVYGDDGTGALDPTNVIFDSVVVGGDAGGNNFQAVVLPAGDYATHWALSVEIEGLFSAPGDVYVTTSIDPPTPPYCQAYGNDDAAYIVVVVANIGASGDPSAIYNDIYRSSPDDEEIRVATQVPINGSWIDYTPANGIVYTYRAVAIAANGAGGIVVTTKTYAYTGARVGFTIPIGVTSLTVELFGGSGGGDFVVNGGNGTAHCQKGGHVKATIGVTPGTICYLRIGGPGGNFAKSTNQPLGGYNGGGDGTSGTSNYYGGGGGGGATVFRLGSDSEAARVLVAGGGGGESSQEGSADFGGSPTQNDGGDATSGAVGSAGRNAGDTGVWEPGHPGNGGLGGNADNPIAATIAGYSHPVPPAAGGGGAGYFGGGSGATVNEGRNSGGTYDPAYAAGRGGHGSNYVESGATSVTNDPPALTSDTLSTQPVASAALTYSLPPAAPANAIPFEFGNVDQSQNVEFSWTNPALPETGDAISGYEIQFRVQGDTDWTSLGHVASTATDVLIDPSNFTANTLIEWQVRSYGTLTGNAGPWSASTFFFAVAPPDPPTINDPDAGVTIAASPVTLDWTAVAGQQAWQARRVGDVAGAPDPTSIYWDSGVNDNPLNITSIPFEAFTRPEHVQVRVQVNGLWSAYADVSVNVAIVPPSAPSITAVSDDDTATIMVTVTNPAGGVTVDHNDVYRTYPGTAEIRVATSLPPNSSWRDNTPANGIVYTYRAVAVAATGAGASS